MNLESFKREKWRCWFTSPVPMLNNQTPIEASKTASGRELLDKLLSIYDSFKSQKDESSIDIMPPAGWVKWRLGIDKEVQGDTIFAAEEAFFKGNDSSVGGTLAQLKRNYLVDQLS